MNGACKQGPLVEALHDGRLGGRERSSVERHLAICETCAALTRDLETIQCAIREPRDVAPPLAHQRARQTLLQRASTGATLPPARAPRASARPVLLLLAATLAAGVVLGGLGRGWLWPATPQVALTSRSPLPTGELTIHPSDGARFEHVRNGDGDVLTLVDGIIDVHVGGVAEKRRLTVRTTDAEIVTTAAVFRIEAEAGRVKHIAVESESVEVRYAGFTSVITAGGSWKASGAEQPAAAAAVESAPSANASALIAAPATARPKGGASPAAGIAAAPSASASAGSTTSREFADAIAALGRADYDDGAAKLDAFARAHPDDARADDAEYARIVALQRAGRRDEAVAAARRYLATRPNGSHRAQATKVAETTSHESSTPSPTPTSK